MRIILRVGLIVGVIGLVALYALQIVAALFVAPAIVVVGIIVGLCMAKWLDRGWYGRQFAAGLRAGAIACGMGALGAALFMLLQGPHSLAGLSARSHLGPLSLAPAIAPLANLGWSGLDVAASVAALVVGVIVAGLTTQIAAASKSRHALRVVEQARLVAQALNRSDAWATPVSGGRVTSGPGLYGAAARATNAPALGPSLSALWPTAAPPSGALGSPSASFGASAPSSVPAFPSASAAGASWGAGVNSVPLSQLAPAPAPATPASPAASSTASASNAPVGASLGGAGLTALPPSAPPPLTQQPKGGRWAKSNPSTSSQQAPAASASTASGAAPGASYSRVPSSARAADSALTDEQRQALATWANDPAFATPTRQLHTKQTDIAAGNADSAGGLGSAAAESSAPATPPEVAASAPAASGEGEPADTAQHRPVNPSTYLNSNPPAKRPRKKQNTRDWLC